MAPFGDLQTLTKLGLSDNRKKKQNKQTLIASYIRGFFSFMIRFLRVLILIHGFIVTEFFYSIVFDPT